MGINHVNWKTKAKQTCSNILSVCCYVSCRVQLLKKSIFYSNAVWSTAFPLLQPSSSSDQYRHVPLWSGLYSITFLKFQAQRHIEIYTEIPSFPREAHQFRVYFESRSCLLTFIQTLFFYETKFFLIQKALSGMIFWYWEWATLFWSLSPNILCRNVIFANERK